MRSISRHSQGAVAALLLTCGAASAQQEVTQAGQPIVVPSQSSVFNQNSVNLPNAPITTGQDIVRGADGTSCQSAIASGGPYLDVGVLQSQDFYARESAAIYGRIVVPIGKRAKRLDCTKLYQLEIERMRMELELLRMGTTYAATPRPAGGLENPPTQVEGFKVGGPAAAPAPPPPDRRASAAPMPSSPRPTPTPFPSRPESSNNALLSASRVPETSNTDLVRKRQQREQVQLPRGYYAQAGAFGRRETADIRMLAAVTSSGYTEGHVKPQELRGQTLYRVMLGPVSEEQAKQICRSIPGDCFVTAEGPA